MNIIFIKVESNSFKMPFKYAQQTALTVIPKITGFTSTLFSSLIVYYVMRNRKKRHHYWRLLTARV
jgi:hypothetical protein